MNIINNDTIGSVIMDSKTVTVNGVTYSLPKNNNNNVSVINGNVYVDGYELKDGEWKRTLKALWYKYF